MNPWFEFRPLFVNTPAHVAVNMLVLTGRAPPRAQLVVLIGAVLPDAPMFWFYFYQKVLRGRAESFIWDHAYFQAGWQNFFDAFNSIPLFAVGLLASWMLRARLWMLLFASLLLHVALDLPLHNDDAHRHFFPLSDWRFTSPVSYWDPRHYGNWFGVIEAVSVLICCALLYQWSRYPASRVLVALIGAVYLAYFGYAFAVWD